MLQQVFIEFFKSKEANFMSDENRQRGKAIFEGKEKEKYIKFLKSMIKDNYGLELKGYLTVIHDELKKEISQSKLSRDFKDNNIRRVKENDKYVYKYIDPSTEPQIDRYEDIIGLVKEAPRAIKKRKAIKIYTHDNCERRLCQQLAERYGMDNLVYIPAYKCAFVVCGNFDLFKKIFNDIFSLFK